MRNSAACAPTVGTTQSCPTMPRWNGERRPSASLRRPRERTLESRGIDDVQADPLIPARYPIEVIERPIERRRVGPAKFAVGSFVVVSELEQSIAILSKIRHNIPRRQFRAETAAIFSVRSTAQARGTISQPR